MGNVKCIVMVLIVSATMGFAQYSTTLYQTSGNVQVKNSSYQVQGSFGDYIQTTGIAGDVTVRSGFWQPASPKAVQPSNPTSIASASMNRGVITFGNGYIALLNTQNQSVPYSITIYDVKGAVVSQVSHGMLDAQGSLNTEVLSRDNAVAGTLIYSVRLGSQIESKVFKYFQ